MKSYLFIFNQPDKTEKMIRKENVYRVIKELDKIISKKEETIFHLLLDSPGGNIYSAYKITNIFRSKCNQLITIIPYRAKSAATLMALGSNEIVMGPQSEIGPLDLPMEHPILEGIGHLSALDGIRSLELLANKSLIMAFRIGGEIRQQVELSRKDSIQIALNFSKDYMKPIMAKFDPWLINMCERSSCIAEEFTVEFLTKYMGKSEKEAYEISDELVRQFPEHSFSISAKRAEDMGLNIIHSVNYRKWNDTWKLFLDLPDNKETIKLFSENQTKDKKKREY
ncbi:hypothetical protein KJA15_00205 [Patescibacteria group bacterium]|nr:hypothetical protein [Patescibacteria group bacterium]